MCQTSPLRSAPCDGSVFMTKRSLYARSRAAFTVAALAWTAVLSGRALAQSSDPPPCSACIVLAAAPGQSVLFSEPLNGLEVLVQMDRDDDGSAVSAALQA